MSVKVMGRVWDLQLSPAKQMVLLALADHAAHDGSSVRPGVPLIAWKTGYSERQVQRIMKDLEADEILVKVAEVRGKPTIYKIDLTKGTPKPAFKPRDAKATPDNMSSESDDYTQGDILSPPTSHEKDDAQGGDIASLDLTSIRHIEPSIKESDAPTPKPETTPLPPHIALAIDNATEKQHNPLINHTGAMMMADVFIRVFEGACKARGAPQRIPRTTSNKLIAAQWYDDGYKEDEIRRTVDLLFEAGKPVAFAFLQEKMSFYRTQQVKKVGVVEDGAIPDEWGVDSFMRQPAQKASAA